MAGEGSQVMYLLQFLKIRAQDQEILIFIENRRFGIFLFLLLLCYFKCLHVSLVWIRQLQCFLISFIHSTGSNV